MLTEEWKKKFQRSSYLGKKLAVIGDSICSFRSVHDFFLQEGSSTPIYYSGIDTNENSKPAQVERESAEYNISYIPPYERIGHYYKKQENHLDSNQTKEYYDSQGNLTVTWPQLNINRHSYFCIPFEQMADNLKQILGCDYNQFSDFFDEVFNTRTTRMDIIQTILSNPEIQAAGQSVMTRVKRALQGLDPMGDDREPHWDPKGTIIRNGIEKMWWYQLAQETGMKLFKVYGWGGRCVTGIKQYKAGYDIYNRRQKGIAVWSNGAPPFDDEVSLDSIYIRNDTEENQKGEIPKPYQKPLYDIRELKKMGTWNDDVLSEGPDVIMIQCMGNDISNVSGAVYKGYYGFDMLGDYDGSKTLEQGLKDFYGEDGIIFEDIQHIYILDQANSANVDGNDTLGKPDYWGNISVEKENLEDSYEETEDDEWLYKKNENKGIIYKENKENNKIIYRYISLERAIDEGHPSYYGLKSKPNWVYEDKRRRYLCNFSLAVALTIARLQSLYPEAEICWFAMGPSSSVKSLTDKITTLKYRAEHPDEEKQIFSYTEGNNPVEPRRYVLDYSLRLKEIGAAFGINIIDSPPNSPYSLQNIDTWIRYNYDRFDIDNYSNYSNYYNKIVFGSHLNEDGNRSKAIAAEKALLCHKNVSVQKIEKPKLKILTICCNQAGLNYTRWVWKLLNLAGYDATVGSIFWNNHTFEDYINAIKGTNNVTFPTKNNNFLYRKFTSETPFYIYDFDFKEILREDWDYCIIIPQVAEYMQTSTTTYYRDPEITMPYLNYSVINNLISALKRIDNVSNKIKYILLTPGFLDPHYSYLSLMVSDSFTYSVWKNYLKNNFNTTSETDSDWNKYIASKINTETDDDKLLKLIQKMSIEKRREFYNYYYELNNNTVNEQYENLNKVDYIIDAAKWFEILTTDLLRNSKNSEKNLSYTASENQSELTEFNNAIKVIRISAGGHLLNFFDSKNENFLLEPQDSNIIEASGSTTDNYQLTYTTDDGKEEPRKYMVTAEELAIIKEEIKSYNRHMLEETEESSEEDDSSKDDTSSEDVDESEAIDDGLGNDISGIAKTIYKSPTIMMPLQKDGYELSYYPAQFLFSYIVAALCIAYHNYDKIDEYYDVCGPDSSSDPQYAEDHLTTYFDAKNLLKVAARLDNEPEKKKNVDFNKNGSIQANDARKLLNYVNDKVNELLNKNIQWYPTEFDAYYTNEKYADAVAQAEAQLKINNITIKINDAIKIIVKHVVQEQIDKWKSEANEISNNLQG